MNKYELAVVLSAKAEDDVRNDVLDRCKALVEKHGGQITNVDASHSSDNDHWYDQEKYAYDDVGRYHSLDSRSELKRLLRVHLLHQPVHQDDDYESHTDEDIHHDTKPRPFDQDRATYTY